MEPFYQQNFTITDNCVNCFGILKNSTLLYFVQEVAGRHFDAISMDYDALAQKGMIWAIIRQKVQITRLPKSGETVRIETWPMPTTKTYFPRSTVAYDENGQELFRAIGMWVLMDRDSRAMVLPGKSGVEVTGVLTGSELAAPGSLAPRQMEQLACRKVCYTDLDLNGHMNNTKYLEWMVDLLPSGFHRDHTAREFTVCYHAEARETEQLHMSWQLTGEGMLQVESWRQTEGDGKFHRVFASQIHFEPNIL